MLFIATPPVVAVLHFLRHCPYHYFRRPHLDRHRRLHHPHPLPVLDLSYPNNFDRIDVNVRIHLRRHLRSFVHSG